MRWGGLLDFGTAGLPSTGDVDVGGPGLTTSDRTNVVDLAWAGENEYSSPENIGNGYNADGSALPPGTVGGRGDAVSPIKHSGASGIVNPKMVNHPLGDPAVWAGATIFGGIAALYFTKKDEDKKGVVTEIALHGFQSFIFLLIVKLAFQRWQVSGVSEVVEFV